MSRTLLQDDIDRHDAKVESSDALRAACAASGRNPLALALDHRRLARGPGRITFREYVDYRLYDRNAYPDDAERLRFASTRVHWPLCHQCSDRTWEAATEDKWMSETLLRAAGLPVANTVAVVGDAARRYGGIPHPATADALAGVLAERDAPLFAKVNAGIASQGATRIVPLGEGRYDMAGLGERDAAGVFAALSGGTGAYLLQDELTNHPDMAAIFGPRVATLRATSFIVDGVARTPYMTLKVPSKGNVADNFWRPGNMVVDVDVRTGVVGYLVRGRGPWVEILDTHPDTGASPVGAQLPDWDAVSRLIRDVGALYAPVKYQSLDIALTPDGPVVVEVNTGGAFSLSQFARGKGFLSDEVIDLFRRCGAEIDTARIERAARRAGG